MAFDFSPGLRDFSAIGNLGQTFRTAQKQSTDAAVAEQRRGLLASLGGGDADYRKVGLGLLSSGDVQGGVAVLGLAQKAGDPAREAEWMRGVNGGGAPSAPQAPSGGAMQGGSGHDTDTGMPKSLIRSESGGNFGASNDVMGAGGKAGHFGRAQFGQARLQEAAAAGAIPQGITPQAFMANPELQKAAERWHFSDIDNFIAQNGLTQAVGKTINGVPVTADGMKAVAHLGGKGGLMKFIQSNGQYNPADDNGTTLLSYLGQHAGGGAPASIAGPQAQVAYTEADNQRLEREMAQNPDSAQPVQMAQNAAVQSDMPASGSQQSQGFVVPGQAAPPAGLMQDPNVQKWSNLLLSAPTDRAKAYAKSQLEIALQDAKTQVDANRDPETIREFMIAKQRGFTQARTPQEYAREKERPRAPVSVNEGTRLINPDTGAVIFDGTQGQSKVSREASEREAEANKRGLQGDARDQYILNGRLPASSDKALPAELGARVAISQQFLEDFPKLRDAAMAGKVTGLIDGTIANFGRGEQGETLRRIKVGSEAIVRNLTGAGMNLAEANDRVKQYEPTRTDDAETVVRKLDMMNEMVQRIEAEAYRGRGVPENRKGKNPYFAGEKSSTTTQYTEGQRASNGQQTLVFRGGSWVPE